MSSPFGSVLGEIESALKISHWIYTTYFQKNNTVEDQYRGLGSDVGHLDSGLKELQVVMREARQELDPFETETRHIAGDFLKTLEQCKELLQDSKYISLKRDRSDFIQKVLWGATAQEQVKRLRAQLQFHTQSLSLVSTKPLELGMLVAIHSSVSELLERTRTPELFGARQRLGLENLIPEWLDATFRDMIAENPPLRNINPDDLPIKEGCVALHRHYGIILDQDPVLDIRISVVLEYLALLKCHWIIKSLRKGREFRARKPGSPFRRFISNVDLEIFRRLESQTEELSAISAPVTDRELKSCLESKLPFLIWEPAPQRRGQLPTDEREGESLVGEVALDGDEKLLIFKNESYNMRLVPVFEQDGRIHPSTYNRPVTLDTRNDVFVPLYTVNQSNSRVLQAAVRQAHEAAPEHISLKDMAAAWALQRAVTGYEVRADENKVIWSMQCPIGTDTIGKRFSLLPKARTTSMTGRVHVWSWSPLGLTPSFPDAERCLSPTSMVSGTSSSGSTTSLPKSFGNNYSISRSRAERSVVAESQRTQLIRETISSNGTLKQLQLPVPPSIIFFGKTGTTHSMFHLEMDYDYVVDPTSCRCAAKSGRCETTVLIARNHKRLRVQHLSSEGVFPRDWNLCTFGGPGRPQRYHDTNITKTVDYEHISLKFADHETREDFHLRLDTYMTLYRRDFDDYMTLKRENRHYAERPQKVIYGTSDEARSMLSIDTRASTLVSQPRSRQASNATFAY